MKQPYFENFIFHAVCPSVPRSTFYEIFSIWLLFDGIWYQKFLLTLHTCIMCSGTSNPHFLKAKANFYSFIVYLTHRRTRSWSDFKYYPTFAWRNWGTSRKNCQGVRSLSEIWTKNLLNTKYEWYSLDRYLRLLISYEYVHNITYLSSGKIFQ